MGRGGLEGAVEYLLGGKRLVPPRRTLGRVHRAATYRLHWVGEKGRYHNGLRLSPAVH